MTNRKKEKKDSPGTGKYGVNKILRILQETLGTGNKN